MSFWGCLYGLYTLLGLGLAIVISLARPVLLFGVARAPWAIKQCHRARDGGVNGRATLVVELQQRRDKVGEVVAVVVRERREFAARDQVRYLNDRRRKERQP
jgi:hypothetical protein